MYSLRIKKKNCISQNNSLVTKISNICLLYTTFAYNLLQLSHFMPWNISFMATLSPLPLWKSDCGLGSQWTDLRPWWWLLELAGILPVSFSLLVLRTHSTLFDKRFRRVKRCELEECQGKASLADPTELNPSAWRACGRGTPTGGQSSRSFCQAASTSLHLPKAHSISTTLCLGPAGYPDCVLYSPASQSLQKTHNSKVVLNWTETWHPLGTLFPFSPDKQWLFVSQVLCALGAWSWSESRLSFSSFPEHSPSLWHWNSQYCHFIRHFAPL